jgi:hypothetical protein
MSDLPKAIYEGEFTLFGVTVHAAVLDDGRRVINAEDLLKLYTDDSFDKADVGDIDGFVAFMKGVTP